MFGLVGFPKRHGVELTPPAVLVSSLASPGDGHFHDVSIARESFRR
jgi:hypothetical protein